MSRGGRRKQKKGAYVSHTQSSRRGKGVQQERIARRARQADRRIKEALDGGQDPPIPDR